MQLTYICILQSNFSSSNLKAFLQLSKVNLERKIKIDVPFKRKLHTGGFHGKFPKMLSSDKPCFLWVGSSVLFPGPFELLTCVKCWLQDTFLWSIKIKKGVCGSPFLKASTCWGTTQIWKSIITTANLGPVKDNYYGPTNVIIDRGQVIQGHFWTVFKAHWERWCI